MIRVAGNNYPHNVSIGGGLNCRVCDCCGPVTTTDGGISETWPLGYTIDTEVAGGAVINSHSIAEGPPSSYALQIGGYPTSISVHLNITAPAGRWAAWLRFWEPDTAWNILETVDVNDQDGITWLNAKTLTAAARIHAMSRPAETGPYLTGGMVLEHGSDVFYFPWPEDSTENPIAADDGGNDGQPWCWRALGGFEPFGRDGSTWNATALTYDAPGFERDCNTTPTALTRVGFYLGLTTAAFDAADDRDAEGTIDAILNIDGPTLGKNYVANCKCWFSHDPATLTVEVDAASAPVEIRGESFTVSLQSNGDYTWTGTRNSLPLTITYRPCEFLEFAFTCTDDDGVSGSEGAWTTTIEQGDGYTGDTWSPIDVAYRMLACFNPTFNLAPDQSTLCGLTFNAQQEVGSPPFVTSWPCIRIWARVYE